MNKDSMLSEKGIKSLARLEKSERKNPEEQQRPMLGERGEPY